MVTVLDKYLVPHTLKKTSEKLNSNNFVQTHRSYWVNIKKISSTTTSAVYLDDEEIPLSSSNRNNVLQALKVI